MRFEVTEHDIRFGKSAHCTLCPVALSLRRGLGLSVSNIRVRRANVSIVIHDFIRNVGLPNEAMNFIIKFDDGFPVVPFSFEIADL